MVTGYEVQAYRDLHSIARSLASIAATLDSIAALLEGRADAEA